MLCLKYLFFVITKDATLIASSLTQEMQKVIHFGDEKNAKFHNLFGWSVWVNRNSRKNRLDDTVLSKQTKEAILEGCSVLRALCAQ